MILIDPDAWSRYNHSHHRHTYYGYRNLEISMSAGLWMARLVNALRRPHQQGIVFVVIDGSTAMLASMAIPHIDGAYASVVVPGGEKHDYDTACPPNIMAVLLEDYLCQGGSLREARQFIGRDLDLAVYIETNKWQEDDWVDKTRMLVSLRQGWYWNNERKAA